MLTLKMKRLASMGASLAALPAATLGLSTMAGHVAGQSIIDPCHFGFANKAVKATKGPTYVGPDDPDGNGGSGFWRQLLTK